MTILYSHPATDMILVVDPDPFSRDITRRFLEALGFSVLLAQDGAAGMDLFRKNMAAVGAVILDSILPDDGSEKTFLELRQMRSNVPVIVCSACSTQEVASRFAGDGGVDYLPKPFSFVQLQSAVRKATRT